MNYLRFSQPKLGSFPVVCAREGGASTTPFQVAHFALRNIKNKTGEKKASNRAKPEKQKGKKEGGLGEGIFALLRLRIERFRFSLIKRKPKQKFFHILLKEKNGGQKKLKNVMKKFLFWFAVAERGKLFQIQPFSRGARLLLSFAPLPILPKMTKS